MQEFNKWDKQFCLDCPISYTEDESVYDCAFCTAARKSAWRASLGLVLASLKKGWNVEDIVNFITKELESS